MKYYWLIYLLIVGNITAFAQLIKVNSDTWSAADALGRKVCEYQDVGEKKKDNSGVRRYFKRNNKPKLVSFVPMPAT